LRNGNTGQIRVVEAFLAVLIIFSAFTASSSLTVSRNRTERDDLASAGLQALMKLDSDGNLGNYIADRNWTSVREALSLALPTGVSFNLTIYDEQTRQINEAVISNGAFSSQNIEFVEYVCASRRPAFHSYIIHLQVAAAT